MEFKSHLITSETVDIPVVVYYSEKLRKKNDWVIFGNGTSSFSDSRSWNINSEHKITIEKK